MTMMNRFEQFIDYLDCVNRRRVEHAGRGFDPERVPR